MLNHLKEKKEVGFFTSIAGLMNSCGVLDLDAFERNTKAEGLGVGSEGAAGEKNMHDSDFTCALFRFIQLTCEGHNLGTILFIVYFHLVCRYDCIFALSFINDRMAKLFENASWKYHYSQCGYLYCRLFAETPRIHNGFLLALLE